MGNKENTCFDCYCHSRHCWLSLPLPHVFLGRLETASLQSQSPAPLKTGSISLAGWLRLRNESGLHPNYQMMTMTMTKGTHAHETIAPKRMKNQDQTKIGQANSLTSLTMTMQRKSKISW